MNNQPDTRRNFNLKLSPSVDGELIQYLDGQPNAAATIKAALYAYMSNQPPQADPLVERLAKALTQAEQLLTTIRCTPITAAAPTVAAESVDRDFVQAVRGNMRPAFKPKGK